MNDAMENHLGLPAIDQVGMVVKDLDAAIEQYNPLFGPFSTMDGSIEAAEFRGRKSDAVSSRTIICPGGPRSPRQWLPQWAQAGPPPADNPHTGR